MILGDCIASGHPQFMTASKTLQKDGQAILFKHGVYRLRLEDEKDDIPRRPSQETARQIRRFDIKVDMRHGDPLRGVKDDLIMMLKESHIPGRKCKIHFRADCILNVAEDRHALEVLQSFRDFEQLAIQIESENHGLNPSVSTCWYTRWQDDPDCLRIWSSLESSLGKAEVTSAEKGYCLHYHPKKHNEASKESVQV